MWSVWYLDTRASSQSRFHRTGRPGAQSLQTKRSRFGRCRWACNHRRADPCPQHPHEPGSRAVYNCGLQRQERVIVKEKQKRWKYYPANHLDPCIIRLQTSVGKIKMKFELLRQHGVFFFIENLCSLSLWHHHVPVPTKAGGEPWEWQTLMHAGRRHLKGAHLYLSHQQIKHKPMLTQSFQQLHHHTMTLIKSSRDWGFGSVHWAQFFHPRLW